MSTIESRFLARRRAGVGRMGFKAAMMRGTFQKSLSARARRAVIRGRRMRGPQVIAPIVVPGFTRTGGFFGRFSGAGGELKFHDIDLDDAVVTTGAAITDSINKIAQGTQESQRIGRKTTIRSINWRFEAFLPTNQDTAAPGFDTIRVLMYLDKQCNGATATTAQILESDDYQSFNNLANKSRFRTLMDRTYSFNVPAGSGADATSDWAGNLINDTFFKKVNIPLEFDSTTGAITEIRSNNIGVLLISRGGLCGFASKIRLRFSDN